MFIRQVKKQNAKQGKVFYQYQLVQAARVDGKVKQHQILYLGSDKELDDKKIRKEVLILLQSKIFKQNLIVNDYCDISERLAKQYYQKYLIKYDVEPSGNKIVVPTSGSSSDYQAIDVKNLNIENNKSFGAENLCKQIVEKLDFDNCFKSLGFKENENKLAQISIISRAIFTASEYRTSQYLEDNSSMKHLFDISDVKISHQSLYNISDKLYQNKTEIDKYLYCKIQNIFNIDDSIVIYDLSNTHFEGRKANSKIAKYGRNKQKRNDCKQVVFTGVINSAGFIRHSRIYEGNKADIATIEDMINDLELHNTNTKGKIIVMDAGFASEDNLKFLDNRGYKYICVSRQRPFDNIIKEVEVKHIVKDNLNNQIELAVFNQEKFNDTWMYVKSHQKRIKEKSITEKLSQRFEDELKAMDDGLHKKGTTKKIEKVWERIGRCKERNRNISGKYIIDVEQYNAKATKIKWTKKEVKEKSDSKHGIYFIRTNIENPTEQMLWDTFNIVILNRLYNLYFITY